MAKKTTRKWIDAQGREVPAGYVPAYDKQRDAIARRIQARFIKCRDLLATCYCASMQDIEELERLAGQQQQALGGLKGNLQFQDFSGLIQISRSARYEISFDERLQTARDLIYSLIDDKAAGIDEDMAQIIRGIFAPNGDGMLSTSRVLGLFRFKVKALVWLRAMDLIRESIGTKRGKTLLSCSTRDALGADWQPILLDLASCAGLYGEAPHGATTNKGGEA